MDAPSPKRCNPLAAYSVAVTLLSVLATAAGATTAQELLIDQPVSLAGDPASPQQLGQGKPANNPPERAASKATVSRPDPATCHRSGRSARKPTSPSSFGAPCRMSYGSQRFGVPG